MLPSQEEFAALVALWPDIPDRSWDIALTAEEAGEMIGIRPGSIRIRPDAPGRCYWLATLAGWRASLPGRGQHGGRPPTETGELLAELGERLGCEDAGRLTVARVRELLADRNIGAQLARRVYVEFTGSEPARGRLSGQ